MKSLCLLAVASPYATWGLIAATTAAMFWAFSVVLCRRIGRLVPPVTLNMAKGFIATAMLSVVLLADWLAYGNPPWNLTWDKLGLMALSGVIGIGLGDTLLFAGLNRMGARRLLLLFTINPAITAVLAWLVLDEPLTATQLAGIAVTCGGVAWVIAERNSERSDGHVDSLGVFYGIAAAVCQAVGYLLSRQVLQQGEMTTAASAWIRLFAGAMVLVAFLPMDKLLRNAGGESQHHPDAPSKRQAVMMFAVALLFGTVLGIWLMQFSAKYADKAGVASTLLSTSPLFVLPVVAMLGEQVSLRAISGALVTLAGIAMLFVF